MANLLYDGLVCSSRSYKGIGTKLRLFDSSGRLKMTWISLLPDLKIQHIIQLVDYICSNRTILNHKYNERIYFYAQSSDLLVVGASSITEIA